MHSFTVYHVQIHVYVKSKDEFHKTSCAVTQIKMTSIAYIANVSFCTEFVTSKESKKILSSLIKTNHI